MPCIAAAVWFGLQAHRLSATNRVQCHPLLARMLERASLDRLHSTWPTLSGVSFCAYQDLRPKQAPVHVAHAGTEARIRLSGLTGMEGALLCRTSDLAGLFGCAPRKCSLEGAWIRQGFMCMASGTVVAITSCGTACVIGC
jgi:hypothetical protein